MSPAELASNQRKANDPCLDDFELYVNEVQKMYGNNDRRLDSAIKAMQQYQQLPNEAV
jgi:hypothetical protein